VKYAKLFLPTLTGTIAMIGLSSAALAAPVSVDGVIGAEWTGVPSVTVTHNLGADAGNFGTPSNITQGASYTVQVRDDGSYYYVALQITGDALSSAGNFANIYFDTNPPAADGSDVGFEVTNNDYFIPGVSGSFDATPYVTYDNTSHPGTIELAILNSFFTSGPKAGIAYPNGYPAATGDVVLRLSQSFGYSVAGGNSYGVTRLGSASVAAVPVPLPAAAWAGFSMLGGFGMLAGLRKRLSRKSRIA
jgi:hypothetical protein